MLQEVRIDREGQGGTGGLGITLYSSRYHVPRSIVESVRLWVVGNYRLNVTRCGNADSIRDTKCIGHVRGEMGRFTTDSSREKVNSCEHKEGNKNSSALTLVVTSLKSIFDIVDFLQNSAGPFATIHILVEQLLTP